ncbi:ORF6N domain-containing protein [Flavitalea sp.]|nr:ORF6N domain-containing protein [Flavitalea sp.]
MKNLNPCSERHHFVWEAVCIFDHPDKKEKVAKSKHQTTVVKEIIFKKIVLLRDEKVILDIHLAEMYGVETRVLKQAVRRNIERFPEDFMFELTEEEIKSVVSQNVIPHKKYLGGAVPFAFTETGVAMLSSILKSKTAIDMNIAIVRAFIAIRKITADYKEVLNIINAMRLQYDANFDELYSALEGLIKSPQPPRARIGFRRIDEVD